MYECTGTSSSGGMSTRYCTRGKNSSAYTYIFHPSKQKLLNLLKRGTPDGITAETAGGIQDIVNHCAGCKRFGIRPYRFCVSVPGDQIVFNHEVAIDLFWVGGNPILHVFDTHTGYQNVGLPKSLSAQHVWEAFHDAWVTVYVGMPNRIRADQGSVFTSKFWGRCYSSTWRCVTALRGGESQFNRNWGTLLRTTQAFAPSHSFPISDLGP